MKQNNTNNKTSNKKLTSFIAPGSTIKITNEEVEKRKKMIADAEEIGQRITKVDNKDEGYENPYRAKALIYIANGKEVPEELKVKIEQFDNEHKRHTNINNSKNK